MNHQNDMCAICLEKINDSDINLKCNHNYHSKCIIKWIKLENNCPICRNIINNDKQLEILLTSSLNKNEENKKKDKKISKIYYYYKYICNYIYL